MNTGPQVYAALAMRSSFCIYWIAEMRSYVRDQLQFLWGNRPKARAFNSGKELFEHTLRKAELNPESWMRFRGSHLTEVNWFGREFDDRYIEILESQADLLTLCKDLGQFYLTATRISESGIEKIRRLLPHVNLIVTSEYEFVEENRDPWQD